MVSKRSKKKYNDQN